MYIYEGKLFDEFVEELWGLAEELTETEMQDLFEYYCRIAMQYFERDISEYTVEDISVLNQEASSA